MKLKKEFVTYSSGDKQITVSTDTKLFSGMIQSNKTGAFIIDALKEGTTREELISSLLEKYDASEEIIAADVDSVLAKLRNINALSE